MRQPAAVNLLEELAPPEPLPAGLAVAPAVLAAADVEPLAVRLELNEHGAHVFLTHARCDQAIHALAAPAGAYRVPIADVRAQLVAHLMQRHGWTREAPA